jgi:hypothetical protein
MKLTDDDIVSLRDTYDDWRKGQGTDYYRIETVHALATEVLESRAEIARMRKELRAWEDWHLDRGLAALRALNGDKA